MNIKPQKNTVYLKIEKPSVGGLNLSSKPTVVELAEVVAIGEGVGGINVGDRVFVKAWALDVITHNKETYYFVNVESGGILATYEETL